MATLTFVDVFGLVGCAVALSQTASCEHEVVFVCPSRPSVAEHLSYMGFPEVLDQLGLESNLPSRPSANFSDVVLTVKTLQPKSLIDDMSNLLWKQLDGRVHPQVLVAITSALWEMAKNALEHSGSPAFIAAQVYHGKPPDHDNRVQIAIGDGGCGIRESFLNTGLHNPEDDVKAIQLAIQYLVSSIPDPGRGQGLWTTIDEVTSLGGKVVVRSGGGNISATQAGISAAPVPLLAGTIVGITIPLFPLGKVA